LSGRGDDGRATPAAPASSAAALPASATPEGPPWAPAAAIAAAVVFGVSAGDAWVAVLALAVAGGPRVAAAAGLAVAATVARWGTADLGAVAGDQAVLGVAVAAGPPAGGASSALAAVALLLVARRGPGRWPFALPVALGLGAAALAAGPAVGRVEDLLVRAAASVLGVAAAVGVAHRTRAPRSEAATTSRPARARTGGDFPADHHLGLAGAVAGVLAVLLAAPS
jgi:hypothetical protein